MSFLHIVHSTILNTYQYQERDLGTFYIKHDMYWQYNEKGLQIKAYVFHFFL